MATAELSPSRMDAYSEGDFVVFRNRPIFKESIGPEEDKYPDGFRYTREVLKGMVQKMNRRIADTGDWCPLVEYHRPKPHEREYKAEPPVCGLVGNFRLSLFGNLDPIWCIFADIFVKKDKEEYVRDHPRLSVELHPEDEPGERFFDPIACLGAETPAQDLGMHFSRAGRPTHHFSAPDVAFPSATSAFVPSLDSKKKKPPQHNAKESDMSDPTAADALPTEAAEQPETPEVPEAGGLSSQQQSEIADLVREIVGNGQAFSQVQLQQIGQMIQSTVEAVVEEKLSGPNDTTEMPDEELPAADELPTEGDAPGAVDEPETEDPAEPAEESPAEDEPTKKPKEAEQYAKMCQYAMDGDAGDAADMYAKMDKESQGVCAQHYAKEDDEDLKAKLKPIFEDSDMSDPKKPEAKTAQQYAKDTETRIQQFQKETSELKKDREALRAEVQQYSAELQEVRTELKKQRDEKAKAICYSRAQHYAEQGYVMDIGNLDDETPTPFMSHVLSLTEDQRKNFFEEIVPQQFQKVPQERLPRERTLQTPLAGEAEGRNQLAKATAYANAHPGVPFADCLAAVATT